MHGNRYKKIYSSFKRGEVVYVDLGAQSHGVQGGIFPPHCCVIRIIFCILITAR